MTLKCQFLKQPSEVFCKKDILRNFSKFTGKHPYQRLFFNKVASVFLWILQNFQEYFFSEHLRTTTSADSQMQYRLNDKCYEFYAIWVIIALEYVPCCVITTEFSKKYSKCRLILFISDSNLKIYKWDPLTNTQ